MRWIAALTVGCFVWHGGGAHALATPRPEASTGRRHAKSDHDLRARARASYLVGVDAYRAGRFRDAIRAFSKADALVPSAALSFDVARAYERLHDGPSAVLWYRDYLRRTGGAAPDRRRVERRIAELTADGSPATAQLSAATPPVGTVLRAEKKDPDTSVSTPLIRENGAAPRTEPRRGERVKPSERETLQTTGYIVAGFGGAAVAGGVALELLQRGSRTDATTAGPGTNVAVADTSAERQEIAARVLVASGAALLATGGVLLVLGSRTAERPQVSAACLPGGCTASFRGKF